MPCVPTSGLSPQGIKRVWAWFKASGKGLRFSLKCPTFLFVCWKEREQSNLLVTKATLPPLRTVEIAFPRCSVLPHRTWPGASSKGPRDWALRGWSSPRTGHTASPLVFAVHSSSSSYKNGLFAKKQKIRTHRFSSGSCSLFCMDKHQIHFLTDWDFLFHLLPGGFVAGSSLNFVWNSTARTETRAETAGWEQSK